MEESVFDPTYGGADFGDFVIDYTDPVGTTGLYYTDYDFGYGDSGYGFDAVNNNFDISGWDASEIQNTATTPGQEGYGWRYFTDGTAISPDGKYYSGGSLVYDPSNQSGFWGGVSGALGTKAANALKSKIMNPDGSVNPAAIGTALAAIKMATGGNDVKTGGYNKPIPKLEAVREQVQYNDPNRAPGSTGRQYFTDTQYVPQGNAEALAAAKDASTQQAAGLQAAAPHEQRRARPRAVPGQCTGHPEPRRGLLPCRAGYPALQVARWQQL
jgi:hypothetical protein